MTAPHVGGTPFHVHTEPGHDTYPIELRVIVENARSALRVLEDAAPWATGGLSISAAEDLQTATGDLAERALFVADMVDSRVEEIRLRAKAVYAETAAGIRP